MNTKDERPKIVDTSKTPIFMMGQGARCFYCVIYRWPILTLCIVMTELLLELLFLQDQIRWCSIEAHYWNGAGSMSHCLSPMKPANATFMNTQNQCPLRLPLMKDEKLLMFDWSSFCDGCMHNTFSCNLPPYSMNGVSAAIVLSSCTFSFITTLYFSNTYKYMLYNRL